MKRILCVSVVIISVLYCFPLTVCLALHDDETLKDGGAWRPAEMNVGPARSGSEEKIDKMLDRSFKKSEIVIPPLESEKGKESDSEENEKKTGDDY
jgi:hypothetical protein